jgi:hypothetical protein
VAHCADALARLAILLYLLATMLTFALVLTCLFGNSAGQSQDMASDKALRSLLLTMTPGTRLGSQIRAAPSQRNLIGNKRAVSNLMQDKSFDVKDLAGVTGPLGFWDPAGFSTDETEGKIRFYREVELKHGRLGMLAALGFLVGENFHPLFGGDIDVPAYVAFQQTPLEIFWPKVVSAIAIIEIFSVFSFNPPPSAPWTIRSDHIPGDFGFDPLGLKPTDPEEFKAMQTKELNNGRLGMLAAAGMIAQELATGEKLFG